MAITSSSTATDAEKKLLDEPSDGKKPEMGLMEEDDEFEEYPMEDWAAKENEDSKNDVNVWEDNWDDDTVEDDFSVQLRAELEKKR